MTEIVSLYGNIAEITPQMVIMWVIGGILIYLGIVLSRWALVPSSSTCQIPGR